jgi:hypothetical protein
MSIIDWRVITQATFFVAVALLGVTVTVYTLGISILGRAIKILSSKFERLQVREREQKEQLKAIKQRLANAKSEKELDEVEQPLIDLQAEIKRWKGRVDDSHNSFVAFKIAGMVYPSLCFFCSIVLSVLGWSLSESGSCFLMIGLLRIPIIPSTWFLALVAMAYGLYRLYLLVKGIRYVAGEIGG